MIPRRFATAGWDFSSDPCSFTIPTDQFLFLCHRGMTRVYLNALMNLLPIGMTERAMNDESLLVRRDDPMEARSEDEEEEACT